MKDLKGRAWNKIAKKFIYFGRLTLAATGDAEDPQWRCVFGDFSGPVMLGGYEEEELFIGALDRTGREIFEGDLVKRHYTTRPYSSAARGKDFISLIIFSDGEFREKRPDTGSFLYWNGDWKSCEVVGNRHENPELMP